MYIVDVWLWHHAHVVIVGSRSWILAFVSKSILSASWLRVRVTITKDCSHTLAMISLANSNNFAIILSCLLDTIPLFEHMLINLTFRLLEWLDIASGWNFRAGSLAWSGVSIKVIILFIYIIVRGFFHKLLLLLSMLNSAFLIINGSRGCSHVILLLAWGSFIVGFKIWFVNQYIG